MNRGLRNGLKNELAEVFAKYGVNVKEESLDMYVRHAESEAKMTGKAEGKVTEDACAKDMDTVMSLFATVEEGKRERAASIVMKEAEDDKDAAKGSTGFFSDKDEEWYDAAGRYVPKLSGQVLLGGDLYNPKLNRMYAPGHLAEWYVREILQEKYDVVRGSGRPLCKGEARYSLEFEEVLPVSLYVPSWMKDQGLLEKVDRRVGRSKHWGPLNTDVKPVTYLVGELRRYTSMCHAGDEQGKAVYEKIYDVESVSDFLRCIFRIVPSMAVHYMKLANKYEAKLEHATWDKNRWRDGLEYAAYMQNRLLGFNISDRVAELDGVSTLKELWCILKKSGLIVMGKWDRKVGIVSAGEIDQFIRYSDSDYASNMQTIAEEWWIKMGTYALIKNEIDFNANLPDIKRERLKDKLDTVLSYGDDVGICMKELEATCELVGRDIRDYMLFKLPNVTSDDSKAVLAKRMKQPYQF